MRSPFIVLGLLVALSAFSETGKLEADVVTMPPELSSDPVKQEKPSEADRQMLEVISLMKDDPKEAKLALPKLDEFIAAHPDYSDAYFVRATTEACILNSLDFPAISTDVKAAMSYASRVYTASDYYSLLAKIDFAKANYAEAVDSLEKAMKGDLDSATRIFNIEGTDPETVSKFCIWNLKDLDFLTTRFPKDYRVRVLHGLYYQFFATFNEKYFANSMADFQKAALLNPTSPLPEYFVAQLYSKESFWTQKAWTSDQSRDELIRNSAQHLTKAIQLDPKFLPAYESRASKYLNLKRYPEAIKDYDKILSLDPENTVAYSDRGLAKLETRQYWASISDLGEAIKRKKRGDSYLPNLFEYRGDAHIGLGEFHDAIADYSKSIELSFGQITILLSLSQIRALYPEYNQVSDEVLCRRIHELFWPNIEYANFEKKLKEENGNWAISQLNELYEKRGDAYLRSGDFRRGALDFERIFKGIPNHASSTDRWRMLGKSNDGDKYYLDVKSVDLSVPLSARFWTKRVGQKQVETVAYEIDCLGKRLMISSEVIYDPNGKLLNSSELTSGWEQIVPDTLGEQLYNGACSK